MKKCFAFPNKVRYSTKKDAETAILLYNDINLDTYSCESCSGWHLTKLKAKI